MQEVQVKKLGELAYQESWSQQMSFLAKRIDSELPDILLSVTHPHCYTLGRRSPERKWAEENQISEWQGVPLFVIERGGEATYHGPGQIVIYPVLHLGVRFGPKALLRMLENSIIECLKEFGIDSYWIEGKTGVWLKNRKGEEKKIASLGIAVRRSISYHGLALNVNTDLSYYKKIQPCGFAPSVMTSMEDLLGEKLNQEEVEERLLSIIQKNLPETR
ncbi:MAG: lipoyl(octanoyl) transferase LipB [Oligoflexia bacterium]|nr:lipoyl(octanoyl) transferase LipB [Oligoflexia bacterium]